MCKNLWPEDRQIYFVFTDYARITCTYEFFILTTHHPICLESNYWYHILHHTVYQYRTFRRVFMGYLWPSATNKLNYKFNVSWNEMHCCTDTGSCHVYCNLSVIELPEWTVTEITHSSPRLSLHVSYFCNITLHFNFGARDVLLAAKDIFVSERGN